MTPRYVSWVGDDVLETSHELNDKASSRTIQVHEQDDMPVSTGLLDHRGHKIVRLPDPRKVGF